MMSDVRGLAYSCAGTSGLTLQPTSVVAFDDVAFTNTKAGGIELWLADTATGQSRLLSGSDRLNGTAGEPCEWLEDSTTLVCTTVPPGRGPDRKSVV